ncbi:MAG: hypothetical protein LBJ31_09120, partial [Treponema sp.]|nr:hypothetical protein [Treponema sp.]
QNMEEKIKTFTKMTDSPFFTFAKPYLGFIGKSKLFSLIYLIMAVVNLILPFVVIYVAINSGIFGWGGAEFVFAFIFSWIVIAFACWVGFQLWYDRKSKAGRYDGAEFIVTPIISEVFQTFGEWLGTLIGIIGAGVGLIATLFLRGDASGLFEMLSMRFMPNGILAVIAGPIIGFGIIIVFRFIAEQMRILVALANNTKSIADNIKR